MKIRRTLKKSHLILTAVSCFLKHSIVDVWQDSEYDSVFEYLRILNMSLVLNMPEFWIYQGYEHVSRFEYARILNILEFWICQGYTGFRICLNNSRIFLNRYAEICLNILNLHEWLLLYFYRLSHIFCNPFSTYLSTFLLIWTSTWD